MSYLIIKDELADNVGKALKYMGKAMTCIEEMENGSEMGERHGFRDYRDMGMRSGYRSRFHDEDFDRNDMGMRQGVAGTGRYGRY